MAMTLEQQRAEAEADAARRAAGHPEFDGSNIPGYDPATGTVSHDAGAGVAGLTSAVEGMPIVGPYAQQGVEKVSSLIGSALSGLPSEQVQGEMSGMVDEAQAAHPYASTAGSVGGAVLGTVPAVLAAPEAFGAGGGSLLARSLISAMTGAGIGGADSGVRGGVEAIPSGAAWGGALGLLGPGVGQAVGAGTKAIASRFGGGSAAEKAFGRAAGADAVTAMDPNLMPMDMGPNLQRQAGALAATPGKGQEIVRSAIKERGVGAGDRVTSTLNETIGQPVDTIAMADDIIKNARSAAKPLYDAAYAKPIPFTTDLEELLKRPSVGKALKKAQQLAADDGVSSKQWFANVADDGAVTIKNTPDVYQLDKTKQALDDMYTTAKRAGNDNEARIFDQLRKKLTGMVDESVPEYKAARDAYAGPAGIRDALDAGQKAFDSNLTPNQLRTQLLKMGESEKEAYLQGGRAKVAQVMGTARNDALAARSLFDKGWNKEKLGILIGDEQAARLLQGLDVEKTITGTRDIVTGNSETAARTAAQKDVTLAGSKPGMIKSALNLQFGDAASKAGERITSAFRGAGQEAKNTELAQLLTGDPEKATQVIKLVQAAQKRGDISAQKAKEIMQSLRVSGAQQGQERQPLRLTVGRRR